MASDLSSQVASVLAHYPPILALASWEPLGNAGGFSGARIWRGTTSDGPFCLRAWPIGRWDEKRIRLIHAALERCRLPIVPTVVPTRDGCTYVQVQQQFWEITNWLPGRADFRNQPSDSKLHNAMNALARIHDCWQPAQTRCAPCPAVGRMLLAFQDWRNLIQSGWKPNYRLPYPTEIHDRARRAWYALLAGSVGAEFILKDWQHQLFPIQTCIRDVWHDHILYTGDQVTGVIDFGAVTHDCVAIDLARLLGSLIPDQPRRMHQALAIYSALRPVPNQMIDLVFILDGCGSFIGLTNWLRWLYQEERTIASSDKIGVRMDALLKRVESKRTGQIAFDENDNNRLWIY